MPSIEKAILDPFAPLSWGDAIMVAVCGMVVVFIVLIAIAVMMAYISKVVSAIERKLPAAASEVKAAPVAAAPKKEEDEEELIAVITAAVAAEMGTTPDQTRLTSIMRY